MSRMCFNCMKMTEDGEFCAFCGKKLKTAPAHHLLPGTILNGKYTVGYALGEGGFGVTYIGLDNSLQIKVAIKEFFPKGIVGRNSAITSDVSCLNAGESDKLFDTEKAKVINEARILAKFSKERGIVNVREYFEANNTAYIVMEYLEGETLEEYLAHSGPISADEAYTLLHPVMKVLEQLHNEGVVHRDISPDNLMFDGEQIKLLDFGAAREVLYSTSKSFSVILKHGYAPEEQYRRKGHQGAWTDVYSLCATLYYCITNVIPDTSLDRMHEDELKRPSDLGVSISIEQEDALMRGLSVLPEDRLQTVADFISAWNGEFVAMPNPQKETIAAYNDVRVSTGEHNKINTSGAETVFGGQAAFVAVDSDERGVSGYYSSNASSTPVVENNEQKSKKKGALVAILCSVIAVLLIGVIIFVIWFAGNKDTDDSQSSTPGTTQSTQGNSENNDTNSPDNTENSSTTEPSQTTTTTEDTLTKYLNQATSQMQSGNYDDALATLDTAEQVVGAHQKITQKKNEVRKAKLLNEISTFEKAGNYKGAIECIANSDDDLKSEPEVIQKSNSLKSTYKNKELSRAQTSYNNGNYDEALSILNATLTILPGDADVTARIEKYTPVLYRKLTNNALSGSIRKEDVVTDSKGNTYNDQLVFYAEFNHYNDGSKSFDKPYIEQYTGGKYSKFKATIIPHKEMDEYNKGCGAVVKIYADDRLVYTSSTITRKGAAVNVDLNITGVQYLKIQVEPTSSLESYYNNYTIILADAKVFS